jgi:hypothetical protein
VCGTVWSGFEGVSVCCVCVEEVGVGVRESVFALCVCECLYV